MENLDQIRTRINDIDAKIADLFEQRMNESRNVAAYKAANGLSISDSSREADIIRRNSQLISDAEIREYYINFEQNLMKLSRDYQGRIMQGMKVAYSGVPGAFAYIAAKHMFPDARLIAFNSFEEAYEACTDGRCDSVVLPLENSYAGDVSAVTDLMFSGDLYINQVSQVEVCQNLLACEGASLESIKEVYSHPQALSQCEGFIRKYGLVSHEYPNTAAAADMVAKSGNPAYAAIASLEAAEINGLKVIAEHINTSSMNTTRFASFSRVMNKAHYEDKMGKHAILVFTVRNEAGALAKTLNIIGAHGFNMCNLHSRPMKSLLWNYYFFIELDGDINTSEGHEMLSELSHICDRLKLVGSFYYTKA